MKERIMTFNLRVNTQIDGDNAWPNRIDYAAELIRKANPIIIGTQEGRYDMLRDLDELLPQYCRIGEGRAGIESGNEMLDECCAIYYHNQFLELEQYGQFWLSETPDIPSSSSWNSSFPRFCTWARFQLKGVSGKSFVIFNTHFDHESQHAREKGAELLLIEVEKFQSECGLPIIITGDFNSYPDNPAIVGIKQQLYDAYTASSETVGCTYHNYKGGTQGQPIDYIFFSKEIHVLEVTVHRDNREGRFPSDHYPISALITL